MLMLEVFPGETVRITASDLTHLDTGPVTEDGDAEVTITLLAASGTEIVSEAGIHVTDSDDWYADVYAPNTTGDYKMTVVAVVAGAVWKDKGTMRVKPF